MIKIVSGAIACYHSRSLGSGCSGDEIGRERIDITKETLEVYKVDQSLYPSQRLFPI